MFILKSNFFLNLSIFFQPVEKALNVSRAFVKVTFLMIFGIENQRRESCNLNALNLVLSGIELTDNEVGVN